MNSFDPKRIERPDPSLFWYYVFYALLSGPLIPVVLLPLWFRYITLRYKFDDDGVSMCWGIIFRREIYLTYRRIQDIHLTRNLLQRWMGLATISVQTASGSSRAEMSIEGILEAEQLRDYLYNRMRGARVDGVARSALVSDHATPAGLSDESKSDLVVNTSRACQLLEEIRDAMAALASSRNSQVGTQSDGSDP